MASVAHSRSVCGNKQFPQVISKRNATSHFNPQTGPSINGGMASKKKHKEKLALWCPDKLDPRCELIANEHVIKRFDLLEETLTKLKIEK